MNVDKLKSVADAVATLAESGRRLEERMDGWSRKDSSKEFHDLESSFAKKTAQKALESGDHDMAKKWVDYGTEHAEKSAAKAERMEAPPEAKKDKKK
jgi:hypothetical protein